ncbi:MAG: anti-sigma factor RsbA family regulatory protein [Acidimicrobiales bacterium]
MAMASRAAVPSGGGAEGDHEGQGIGRMGAETLTRSGVAGGFRHEALLYAGEQEFLDAALPFIVDGLTQDEHVLVAVSARKIDLLRDNLGWDGQWVDYLDMAELGTNPGRIISAWRQFVFDHRSHPHLRGIGEPVWAERTPAELLECQHHEVLLNVAFAPERPWRLLCPYDKSTLGPAVIHEARRSHPYVQDGEIAAVSDVYPGVDHELASVIDAELPEPAVPFQEVHFDEHTRSDVLRLVIRTAARLSTRRSDGLILAVHEITENSVRHGGGQGTMRIWAEAGDVVCEVRDAGWIREPLVGRDLPPNATRYRGGLWLAHDLCDLVQVRSSERGTVVRMSMRSARA